MALVLPAATFPPLAWFHLAQTPGAVVCQHENFVKQSVRNRILLVESQGATFVSLPVHRRNARSRNVMDIVFTDKISPECLLKPLHTNCGSAPFFDHYIDEVQAWANAHLQPGASWWDAAFASSALASSWLGLSMPLRSDGYLTGPDLDDWRPKGRWNAVTTPRYPQVFEDRLGFVPGRSILDVILHLGPEAASLPSHHGNDPIEAHRPS